MALVFFASLRLNGVVNIGKNCRYLRDTLHFIDKRRVAVWGWSYGGFVAALALASPKSVFRCAIAVAPVTNWKLYGEMLAKF